MTYQLCAVFWTPKLKIVKVYGRPSQLTSAISTVITTVETISCFLRACSISFTVLISKKYVANNIVMRHPIIPIELTRRGYIIGVNSRLIPKDKIEATTRATHDDSAYEPKRSDPMLAISPTLSAMTCKCNNRSFLLEG
jgi:hypothetical protein